MRGLKNKIFMKKYYSNLLLVNLIVILLFAICSDARALEVPITGATNVTNLVTYIEALYNFVIGSIGLLATVMIMYAGFLWMTARGNAEQVGKAKKYMAGAVSGIILALSAYLILNVINPDLTKINSLSPQSPPTIVSPPTKAGVSYSMCTTNTDCQSNECLSGTCIPDPEVLEKWYCVELDVPDINSEELCLQHCKYCR